MKTYTLFLHELPILAQDIAQNFKNGVIVLRGDLAAGKTTLVQKVVESLGIKEEVTSPTFSLQHRYGNGVFHYDMYNHGLEHFMALGMLEELERDGLHFVEWGDDTLLEILDAAQIESMTIDIEKISGDKREYRVCTH